MRLFLVNGMVKDPSGSVSTHSGFYDAVDAEQAIGKQAVFIQENHPGMAIVSSHANDVTDAARKFVREYPETPQLIAHEATPQGHGSLGEP